MIDVTEINEIAALRSYHLAWSALHAETPRASFFQTFDWFQTWWSHSGEGKQLRVLVIRAGDHPLGIVPLVEQTESGRLGPLRVLTYASKHGGPIGMNQTAMLAIAMRHLVAKPPTWEVFAARGTAHDTADRGRTELAMRLAGLTPTVEAEGEDSAIDFAAIGDWDSYLATRPDRVRQAWHQQEHRLREKHDLRFVRHRPEPMRYGEGEPRWDLYESCEEIDQKSGQEQPCPMRSDHHASACRLGMSDLSVLLVDGRPAAYHEAYHCHGEVTSFRAGCDPSCPEAGEILLRWMVEDGFARGDSRLGLGNTHRPHDRDLRTSAETAYTVSHQEAGAWQPRLLRAARRLAGSLSRSG